ncbi:MULTISPECIES: hypothetical protein [unclassified Neisseria]|uniref:hypothetical protein n=1 Tax=unclassified Neisseria TaxID=2623750 RepID=UPI001071EC5C|nr:MULTISPECIES: hypothetical protein [unclassified Neisseria]MBF0803788.1 hypothetical protein [Neisseria sp. 19428wB4_WF04]TFU43532.1 hypothetical protein E4T99_05380 [Neisseria sp. WF04]
MPPIHAIHTVSVAVSAAGKTALCQPKQAAAVMVSNKLPRLPFVSAAKPSRGGNAENPPYRV